MNFLLFLPLYAGVGLLMMVVFGALLYGGHLLLHACLTLAQTWPPEGSWTFWQAMQPWRVFQWALSLHMPLLTTYKSAPIGIGKSSIGLLTLCGLTSWAGAVLYMAVVWLAGIASIISLRRIWLCVEGIAVSVVAWQLVIVMQLMQTPTPEIWQDLLTYAMGLSIGGWLVVGIGWCYHRLLAHPLVDGRDLAGAARYATMRECRRAGLLIYEPKPKPVEPPKGEA